MNARLAVPLAAAVLAATAAPSVLAREVTRSELDALAAAAAAGDARALAELRRVEAVDGRQVDLGRALAGARGRLLRQRIRVLREGAPGAPPPDATAARSSAAEILADRRFRGAEPPRPFRRPLTWLSERVAALGERLARVLAPVVERIPGGGRTLWAVAALVLLLGAALAARRVVDARVSAASGRVRERSPGTDPRRLEREADEAETRGDFERALRLRFRAGLVRLQRAGVLPRTESATSGEIARRLRSQDFDRLAALFDEVVYGRRPARRDDVEVARRGWMRVLAEAGA